MEVIKIRKLIFNVHINFEYQFLKLVLHKKNNNLIGQFSYFLKI